MYTPLWLRWAECLISFLIFVFLFLQGYLNIKTGKVTQFGADTLFRLIDTWLKNKKARWDDPRRIRITGIIAIILALEFLLASVSVFVYWILPT